MKLICVERRHKNKYLRRRLFHVHCTVKPENNGTTQTFHFFCYRQEFCFFLIGFTVPTFFKHLLFNWKHIPYNSIAKLFKFKSCFLFYQKISSDLCRFQVQQTVTLVPACDSSTQQNSLELCELHRNKFIIHIHELCVKVQNYFVCIMLLINFLSMSKLHGIEWNLRFSSEFVIFKEICADKKRSFALHFKKTFVFIEYMSFGTRIQYLNMISLKSFERFVFSR